MSEAKSNHINTCLESVNGFDWLKVGYVCQEGGGLSGSMKSGNLLTSWEPGEEEEAVL